MSKDIKSIKEEMLPVPQSQTAFRRVARDFAILQTGMQALEEDLLGIAEVLGIPIERGHSMPRVQEPSSKPSTPDMRSKSAKPPN